MVMYSLHIVTYNKHNVKYFLHIYPTQLRLALVGFLVILAGFPGKGRGQDVENWAYAGGVAPAYAQFSIVTARPPPKSEEVEDLSPAGR